MDAVFRFRERALKLPQSPAHSLPCLRQPVGPEDKQDNEHQDDDFTATQVSQSHRQLPAASISLRRFGRSPDAGGGTVVGGGSLGSASLRPRLNSLIPFPIDAPISGMRFAPKNSTRMSTRIAISVKPRLPSMGAFLKERTGHEIRDDHADDGEERDIEPDRSERNRQHQQI